MIYKNEDGSIYKIEKKDADFSSIGDNHTEIIAKEISAINKSINEINEVLNYLLKKTKIIKYKKEENEK